MVNAAIVQRLANNLQGYITQLREVTDLDRTKFRTDVRSQRFVERTLQISVEAILDIAHHVISDEGYREPGSYADAFAMYRSHRCRVRNVFKP